MIEISKLPSIDNASYGPYAERGVYNKVQRDLSEDPEAQVRQKLAKNNAWAVCKSGIDTDKKLFWYEVAVNAHDSAIRTISFDEACKEMHWAKFELINDSQTIKHWRDPKWDAEVDEIQKKLAKKAPAEAEDAEPELEWKSRGMACNWAAFKG
jgi:hypothetical protein